MTPGKHHFNSASLIFLISFGIFYWNCARQPAERLAAEWRDIKITLTDFERTYFYYWQTTSAPDSPELRRQFAQQMIEQELIARVGEQQGLKDDPALQRRLQRDFNYFVRRRYLQKTVQDTIAAPLPAEIDLALSRQNVQLRVRELFAATEEEIHQLAARLENGENFAELASETIPDKVIAARGGDLGWIGWGDTDLPVEAVLYEMKIGEISRPVQSLMGWHIFRLDSIRTTMRFGEVSPLVREEIGQRIKSRRLDMAASRYLRELIWSKQFVVDMRVMQRVWNYLAPFLAASESPQWLESLNRATEHPPSDVTKEIAATVDGEPFTVQEFLDALVELPKDLLRPNLKKALEVAIRDKILTVKALAEGFGNDPVVREKTRRTELQHLYFATLAASSAGADIAAPAQKQNSYELLHRSLLPKDYHPRQIRFYEDNLKKALTGRRTVF